MAKSLGHMALIRPSTIAVHEDGNVPGDGFDGGDLNNFHEHTPGSRVRWSAASAPSHLQKSSKNYSLFLVVGFTYLWQLLIDSVARLMIVEI
ncbi:MAG: hypothetical protein JJD98_17880 [Polaromonas sp.]|nr:hypothetical protein [Polaromonas sp.]